MYEDGITQVTWKHLENVHKAISASASTAKKVLEKGSVPHYSGALLRVGGDDLEKQFHCSINSQHGCRGD